MSRLSSVLSINPTEIKTRSFEYHNQVFRVRIPTIGEIEQFENDLKDLAEDKVAIDALYEKRRSQFKEDEDTVLKDDEVWVKGRALRDIVKSEYIGRLRITWLFNLFEKKNDDGLGPLTYEDIASELPMQIQTELVDLIGRVMAPELEEVKKNSLGTPAANSTSTSSPIVAGPNV